MESTASPVLPLVTRIVPTLDIVTDPARLPPVLVLIVELAELFLTDIPDTPGPLRVISARLPPLPVAEPALISFDVMPLPPNPMLPVFEEVPAIIRIEPPLLVVPGADVLIAPLTVMLFGLAMYNAPPLPEELPPLALIAPEMMSVPPDPEPAAPPINVTSPPFPVVLAAVLMF